MMKVLGEVYDEGAEEGAYTSMMKMGIAAVDTSIGLSEINCI
jgi:hypothetical protein